MKSLKFKLLAYVGLIVFIFSTILFYRTYTLISSHIEDLTHQQLALGLNFDLAIRDYVAECIRPLMFNILKEGEFKPEVMSTSYVARNIFNKVRQNFPDYIIKFSAENPRNPVNQAGPEELQMIKYFNENSQQHLWTGEISMGGRNYLAKFSAMRMEQACLRCHGDPADAPVELLLRYGSKASFYRPLGEVVGLDTVAMPMDKIKNLLWRETGQNFILLSVGLVLLCLCLAFILKIVITDRLGRITEHFAKTEGQDGALEVRPIDSGGQDEIATLSNNFNKLANRLNDYYALLEEKVSDRTRELSKANEQLKREIEDRKQAETMLKRSEGTLRSIFQSAPIGIGIVTDRDISWTNDQFQRMVGYSTQELEGQNARILYINEEEYERVGHEVYAQINKTGIGTVESRYKRKDGEVIDVLLNSAPINPGDLSEGRIFTVLDITQTKRMQEQLNRSERLAATGQLAASVAHEINSPLQAVTVMLGMLQKKYGDDKELSDSLGLLKEAFGSIRDTVRNLLDLNRPGKEAKQSVNINHIIQKTVELVRSHLKKNKINVTLDLSSNLPDIYASPQQLNQCFLNIINNAVEAIASVYVTEENEEQQEIAGGAITIITKMENEGVVIKIADTGPGIAKDEIQHIFDPFFTSKKKMGMGIGLSICHGIVADQGGIITAENRPQGGVVMTITLPLSS